MEAAPPPIFPLPTPGQSYNPTQVQSKGQVQTNYLQVQTFPFIYKNLYDVEERKQAYNKLRSQFLNKIPTILEKDPKSNAPNIDKNKYLNPEDFTISQFKIMIRKRINFPSNEVLFLLANGRDLLDDDSVLSDVYMRYKDPEDGFLYIVYTNQIQPYQNQSYSSNSLNQAFLFKFKADYNNVKERKKECEKILKQYPGKIPIVCEKDPRSSKVNIDKNKYLVPNDFTLSQFSSMIRSRIKLLNDSSFTLLVNGRSFLEGNALLSEIYKGYKDPDDGFLYISYI